MFFKIFFQAFALYLFIGGYFLTFTIMMIQKSLILNSFWISFVGGFTLCMIWGFCIKLFTILLSEQELAKLFKIPLPEGIADAFNEDDDDDLTLNDLYNPDDDLINDDSTGSYVVDPIIRSDPFSPPERDTYLDSSDEASTSGRLDRNGNFDLTVAGRTLKASPQDGAQAIRKTLHDSEIDN